jgi:hypothetical protein
MGSGVTPRAGTSPIVPAVVGGIIGGVLIDLFLIATGSKVPGLWQWVASNLVGPSAFSSPSYAVLGLVLHFATSIFWAIVYVYVWRAVNDLSNWIVGGLVWGVVVMVAMTAFLTIRGTAPPATVLSVIFTLIGHWIYGLSVAWYVHRSVRAA